MRNFLKLVTSLFLFTFGSVSRASSTVVLVDFKSARALDFWSPLTDQIRGGRSTAFIKIIPNQTAHVYGVLTLLDNAGFASYRVVPLRDQPWNLLNAKAILIESRGDGRVYKFLLKDRAALNSQREYSWEAEFQTTDRLTVSSLSLNRFKATYRGRQVEDVEPLDIGGIIQMGIQLNDKIAGPYEIDLKSVSAEF